jgi:hypothetical protein
MSALPAFRHYCICQDAEGGTIELWRSEEEVACLAFDTKRQVLVELHVAVGPAERQRDLRSFQNLLQLAAPLRHRHLLGIIEGGEDDGANYHITDFLDGERLDSWLKRLVPLPSWLALTVLLQVVEGLAALASHPRLLAGVEVFHAGIMLTGERVDDVLVKVCDLGLAGARPMSTEPQFVEARAIHEAGRLLLYMLTGSLPDGEVTAETWSGSHAAPELGFLLATIFQASAPHHPRTLEQLRNLVERCLHDLPAEAPARPDKLPAALRPRLPLTGQLPSGEAIAEAAGGDWSVDTRPGDAAQPYRHRGTERATRHPVVVQALPPPEIVPTEFFAPALDQAWAAAPKAAESPHLLKLRHWNFAMHPAVIVEDLPGKWTLDAIVRLRQRLDASETLLILTQLDAAAEAAAALSLPLLWRSPALIPVQFDAPGTEEELATAGRLARLPLGEWPAFHLKLRTWPLMLNFTQPERFQTERLLPRGEPGLPVDSTLMRSGILTPPTSRDLALLAVWMMGGASQLQDGVKPLIYEALRTKSSAAESRRDFLERFRQRLEVKSASVIITAQADDPEDGPASDNAGPGEDPATAHSPLAVRPKPPVPPQPVPGNIPGGHQSGNEPSTRKRNGVQPQERPGAPKRPKHGKSTAKTAAAAAFAGGAGSSQAGTAEGSLFSQATVDVEDDAGAPAMGFAEALFGSSGAGGRSPGAAGSAPAAGPAHSGYAGPVYDEGTHPLFGGAPGFQQPDPHPDIPEGAPLGFMEAAGQHHQYANGPDGLPGVHLPPRRSPWMLVLVVILISAAIAALMAELSGRAVWHR